MRLSTAFLVGCVLPATHSFHLPPASTSLRRPVTAATTSSLSMSAATSEGEFTSESAKQQIGNDSFLNENLMARAQNGPGKVNDEKLKIGVVGAGLAGMVAAMDLADAGHDVEMFESQFTMTDNNMNVVIENQSTSRHLCKDTLHHSFL